MSPWAACIYSAELLSHSITSPFSSPTSLSGTWAQHRCSQPCSREHSRNTRAVGELGEIKDWGVTEKWLFSCRDCDKEESIKHKAVVLRSCRTHSLMAARLWVKTTTVSRAQAVRWDLDFLTTSHLLASFRQGGLVWSGKL